MTNRNSNTTRRQTTHSVNKYVLFYNMKGHHQKQAQSPHMMSFWNQQRWKRGSWLKLTYHWFVDLYIVATASWMKPYRSEAYTKPTYDVIFLKSANTLDWRLHIYLLPLQNQINLNIKFWFGYQVLVCSCKLKRSLHTLHWVVAEQEKQE